MPELPEVEIMCRCARRWMVGRRIEDLVVVDPRLVKAMDADPIGDEVVDVRRRAKHMIIEGRRSEQLLHFRMTGKLVRPRPGLRPRARWSLSDGTALVFSDTRCLGELRVLPPGGAEAWLEGKGLGPEPYPQRRPGAWWAAALGGLRGALKPALMRQDRVAGLGNIAATEICWASELSPTRPVPSLSEGDWARLAEAAHAFLEATIEQEQADEIHYLNDGGDPGSNPFEVYGRAGQPCPRCAEALVSLRQSGRTTTACPSCQR